MEEIYIVGAVRTPIGKFAGTLAKTPAAELGALVIRDVLRRAGVKPEQVSEVILGQVLTAGIGQNGARQAAIKAGLPEMIPGQASAGSGRRTISATLPCTVYSIFPESAARIPASKCSSVVLPDPLVPISATCSPSFR